MMEQITEKKRSTLPGQSKWKMITYWIVTGLLALVFINGGLNDVFKQDPYYGILLKMGYPGFVAILLGIWKVLGAIVLLIPGFKLIKEWAYAGFFFLLTGAIISHLQIGDLIIFQLIILILLAVSWYLRPEHRRLLVY
jgi:uncharacterized membrane protein YphA (DoxX/SURF4 family)